MSLIPQDKIEDKIVEKTKVLRRNLIDGNLTDELFCREIKDFISLYNEQLIEEIQKMKHNPAKDTHEIGMNQGFTDMICKLKDQSLSDNK